MNTAARISAIPVRFSAAAETYEQHSAVQDWVATRLIEALTAIRFPNPSGPVLEIGCGTGLLTRRVRVTFPGVPLLALDLSAAMVAEARRRMRSATPPGAANGWAVGDAVRLPCRAVFEAVVSSSAVHWAESPTAVLSEMSRVLRPGGGVALAVMTAGTLGELRRARREAAPDQEPPADLPAAAVFRAAARAAGFQIRFEAEAERVETYPSAVDFLRAIHEQGLTGGRFSNTGRLLNRTQLGRLIAGYERDYGRAGGVAATYRVLWLIAEKIPTVAEENRPERIP